MNKKNQIKRNNWSGSSVLKLTYSQRYNHVQTIIKSLMMNSNDFIMVGLDRIVFIIIYNNDF